MIKVIKKGIDFSLNIYNRICPRCECEFEFEYTDKEHTYFDEHNGSTQWRVMCPNCGDDRWFYAPNPIRYKE